MSYEACRLSPSTGANAPPRPPHGSPDTGFTVHAGIVHSASGLTPSPPLLRSGLVKTAASTRFGLSIHNADRGAIARGRTHPASERNLPRVHTSPDEHTSTGFLATGMSRKTG